MNDHEPQQAAIVVTRTMSCAAENKLRRSGITIHHLRESYKRASADGKRSIMAQLTEERAATRVALYDFAAQARMRDRNDALDRASSRRR